MIWKHLNVGIKEYITPNETIYCCIFSFFSFSHLGIMKLKNLLAKLEAIFAGVGSSVMCYFIFLNYTLANYPQDKLIKFEGQLKEYTVTSQTSIDFELEDSTTLKNVLFYFEGQGLRYVYDGISQLSQGDMLIIHSTWNDELKKQQAHEVRTPNAVIYVYRDKIMYLVYISIFCFSGYLILFFLRKKREN